MTVRVHKHLMRPDWYRFTLAGKRHYVCQIKKDGGRQICICQGLESDSAPTKEQFLEQMEEVASRHWAATLINEHVGQLCDPLAWERRKSACGDAMRNIIMLNRRET